MRRLLLAGLWLGAGCAQNPQRKADFTHVVTVETRYYLSGPQQARPPEGAFPAGTRIAVIEEHGSYALVESADGVRAHVSVGSFEKSQP